MAANKEQTSDEVKVAAIAAALAWLLSLTGESSTTDKALLVEKLATEEFGLSEIAARIVVADMAQKAVDAVQKAVDAGSLTEALKPATLPSPSVTPEIPAGAPVDVADVATAVGVSLEAVIAKGLDAYNPSLALQNSARVTFNAGRYESAMEPMAQSEEPYFLYHTMLDGRVRRGHVPLEAVCLPKSHKFWDDHYPPNGQNCRCWVEELSAAQFQKLLATDPLAKTSPPDEPQVMYVNKVTGEVQTLPASIEPGFDFNPGMDDGKAQLLKLLNERVLQLSQDK